MDRCNLRNIRPRVASRRVGTRNRDTHILSNPLLRRSRAHENCDAWAAWLKSRAPDFSKIMRKLDIQKRESIDTIDVDKLEDTHSINVHLEDH